MYGEVKRLWLPDFPNAELSLRRYTQRQMSQEGRGKADKTQCPNAELSQKDCAGCDLLGGLVRRWKGLGSGWGGGREQT